MRLSPPFSGQVQIAETDKARALTLDGEAWEMQFIHKYVEQGVAGAQIPRRRHVRAAALRYGDLQNLVTRPNDHGRAVDARIVELAEALIGIELPFPASDNFEYWLLDAEDGSPLAFLWSCGDESQTVNYERRPNWTALPAIQMPIEKTDEEIQYGMPPVNARLESLIRARAGQNPKACWFDRSDGANDIFPSLLVKEDWHEEGERDLCQRYLQRQAPRLLMLHNLKHQDRLRMEQAARSNVLELARFYPVYPDVVDTALMNTMRVEARLRDKQTYRETP
jgi:hypothetical protein